MKYKIDNKGFTLVEVIMVLAILAAVILPLMNIFILSQKINSEGKAEYSSIQAAQYYMEELYAMDGINPEYFSFNSENGSYERKIYDGIGNYDIEIRISLGEYGIHYIEIEVLDSDDFPCVLNGSLVIKNFKGD